MIRATPQLLAPFLLLTAAGGSVERPAHAQERTLEGHTNVVAAVCFAPDGQSLLSGSWDETVRLWDARTAAPLHTFSEHTDWVEAVVVTPDGKTVVAASQREVRVWDLPARRHEAVYDHHRSVSISAMALSSDGKQLACGARDGTVLVWPVGAEQPRWRFKTDVPWTKCLAFSSDGKKLAAGDWLGRIRIWDLTSGREIQSLDGHSSSVVAALCFNPDGTELASGSYDASIKLWDVATGKSRATLTGHKGLVLALAYSRDGTLLASGERHGPVKLWSAATGKVVATFKGHPDAKLGFSVIALAFSPDTRILASASYDKSVKLWTVPEQR